MGGRVTLDGYLAGDLVHGQFHRVGAETRRRKAADGMVFGSGWLFVQHRGYADHRPAVFLVAVVADPSQAHRVAAIAAHEHLAAFQHHVVHRRLKLLRRFFQ